MIEVMKPIVVLNNQFVLLLREDYHILFLWFFGEVEFLGEERRDVLASTLVSYCMKCEEEIMFVASLKSSIGSSNSSVSIVNIGAVLGQISIGGGGAHLEEQFTINEDSNILYS